MRHHVICISISMFVGLAACAVPMNRPEYPATRRVEVADTYHGVTVADPYRWLEQPGTDTAQWIAAQNALSQPYLEGIPAHAKLKQRLTELWNYDQYGYSWMGDKAQAPVKRGGRYFFVEKTGNQDQGVLYWAGSLAAAPRVLVDPNGFSDDATTSLANYVVSPDGRHVAFAVSVGGTDWDTWQVREVESGRDLPERLADTKFTSVSWTPDGSAFYYSRYPRNAAGQADDQRQVQVYLHRLGTPQSEDALVYQVTDHDRHNPYAEISADGRWLLLNISHGFDANAYYLRDLQDAGGPVLRILDRWDGRYEFLGVAAGRLLFKTTQGAPRGRVISLDPAAAGPEHWREILPQQAATLHSASLVGGHLIANHLAQARSQVTVYQLDGSLRNEIMLPGLGTVAGFADGLAEAETFFSYTDYLTPGSLYHYDVVSNALAPFRKPGIPFDGSPYVTEQLSYTSADGTVVPMFITRRRDLPRDGQQPTLLYGYGGFDVSLTPGYSPVIAAWLEMGGIYAVANLRGGGEFGAEWHAAGTRTRKQNVFDDFIAAAEYLIAERYTTPARLAIHGRSNGGLLVGAVLAQRPELFAAALPGVGVLDMLRYHTASANAYAWSSDYGTVEDEAEFKALHAYSPLHNLQPGQCYPATLVAVADGDDRVVPWHSYKFAAALQHAQACAAPVIIRIETRAGHGAGKPTWMHVENWANHWAFLARQLGMAGGD